MLGYGRVPGLSSKNDGTSAAAAGSVSITGLHEFQVELAFGRNRFLGVELPQMLNVALVVGHPCKLSERGPNQPEEAKFRPLRGAAPAQGDNCFW